LMEIQEITGDIDRAENVIANLNNERVESLLFL